MLKAKSLIAVVIAAVMFSSCSAGIGDIGKTMALVNSLEKVGLSAEQAVGGIGAILSLAKGKLDPSDFSKIAGAFPDMNSIMKEAKNLGVGSVTDMASLTKNLSKLGLKPTDAAKLIPEVTKYVGKTAGSGAADILSGVLK